MHNEAENLEDRARQACKIARNPDKYKVCLCCESIVTGKVVICPNCHGYRFNGTRSAVVAQAEFLGKREQHSVLVTDLE